MTTTTTDVYEPDLDLFTVRATQVSHESVKFVSVHTLSNLQNVEGTVIEFDVPLVDSYVNLKNGTET